MKIIYKIRKECFLFARKNAVILSTLEKNLHSKKVITENS